MHWTETPIHVIDFEGNRAYGVVEFGVVTLFGGEVAKTSTRLCRANRPMEPIEENFHGIPYSHTLDHPPFRDFFDDFSALRQTGVFAAHHAAVEKSLIKSVWPYPAYSPDFLNPRKEMADWGPWIDTRVLYAALFPQLENHKLGNLIKVFGLETQLNDLAEKHCPPDRANYHCALYDALGAAALLQRLGELPEFEAITLEWLIKHSRPRKDQRDSLAQGEFFNLSD